MIIDMPAAAARGVRARAPAREVADRRVSELCHDLRQPSAALSLLAMAAMDADLPERTQERLTQIAREVGRLSSMVHSVLSGLSVWEPVELGGIARSVVDSFLITYDGEITLSVRGRADVLGQRVQLDRALSNLVQNAAHASGEAGHVHIEVATDGDTAQLTVEDDGPGLIRAAGGVSLGLLIVDRVAREHSGDVIVGDSSLGGTRIEMRFPLIQADRPAVRT